MSRRWSRTLGMLAASCSLAMLVAIPSATSASEGQASDPAELTPAQVAAQVQEASALQAELAGASAALAKATQQLMVLSTQSGLLLGRLSEARAAESKAKAAEAKQRAALAVLSAELVRQQDAIGHWAHDTYVRGNGQLEDLAAMVQVLTTRGPAEGADSLGLLQYLADQRVRKFDHLTTAAERQTEAVTKAAAARAEATRAASAAAAAKTALDKVVRAQQVALDQFRLAEATAANSLTAQLLASSAGADEALRQALGNGAALPVAGTCRADDGAYSNGQLPASALCPLYRSPGEYLREAPARAFNALSKAFEQDTGRPLCVTDGYRTYAQQVALYAAKPTLAARPGTSQHGLGMALDLCGGVQSFGDPAHLWMRQHAPLFGWFHPSWAEADGSKPEPWHWEFAS